MRVIGGKYRSRVLAEFKGEDVRPTSDRAKEALFNILAYSCINARALDLFSGSGALGIECLSRGAKEVVFNDFSKDSLAILKKNLTALKIPVNGEEAKVYNYDYSVCLEALQGQFDLIFLDPPYRFDYGEKALEKMSWEAAALAHLRRRHRCPAHELVAVVALGDYRQLAVGIAEIAFGGINGSTDNDCCVLRNKLTHNTRYLAHINK